MKKILLQKSLISGFLYNCMSVMVFRIVMKAHETLKYVLVCCLQLAACQEPFAVTDSTWNLSHRCIIKFVLSYLTLLLIHSKILLLIFRFATVAHLAEQHIRNVQVAGSIPASGSTKLRSQHRSFFMQGNIGSVKKALLKMLGWRILQGFQSLFHFLKKRCFHRLLREYPTDSLL